MPNPARERSLRPEFYRYYLSVLARCMVRDAGRLRNKIEPSDVVQETLLQAHKTGSNFRGHSSVELMAWLRQILDWRDEVADATRLAESFRSELRDDAVYVLTPHGRVVDLPMGATAIDFAYHVHTEIGHSCRYCMK